MLKSLKTLDKIGYENKDIKKIDKRALSAKKVLIPIKSDKWEG